MATPTQCSWGGLVKFTHDFPYISGDVAVVQYKTPQGTTGELPALTFDDTEITARIPANLLDVKGLYWFFNMKVEGTRDSGDFSIQSEVVRKRLNQGIFV